MHKAEPIGNQIENSAQNAAWFIGKIKKGLLARTTTKVKYPVTW